jgi:hypothetical protein
MTRRLPVIAAAATLSLVLGVAVAAVQAGPATAAPETCPSGLPSRSVSPKDDAPAGAAKSGAVKAGAAAGSGKAATGKTTPANGSAGKAAAGTAGAGSAAAGKAAGPAPAPKPGAETTTTPTPTAPPADEAAKDTGNPIVDGWNNFIDGVGHLLGLGGDETPSPSPTPSPSATPAASPSPGTATSPPAGPSGPGAGPGTGSGPGPGSASTTASPSPTPTPTPTLPDIPCLGPRVFKAATLDDGQPKVSIHGGLLEGKSLLMTGSTYDGVVDLPTATGTVKTLKFSMENAVTEPFTLTIPENGGHKTVIKTDKLEIDKDVKFYTSRFAGNLFGIIPVVFTPESPPPLTVYKLWFTNVSIDLDYVSCHTLTATPMLSVTAVQ